MKSEESLDAISNRFVAITLNDLKNNCLKLPTLPEVATRVRQAIDDPNCTATKIARTLEIDASLSARLVRLSNSALYRGTSPIDTVQAAITRLGNKTVREVVTSLIMQQLFQTKSQVLKKRIQRLWLHSTEVAALSAIIARRFTKLSVDKAMLAGLVHDIGALPLLVRAEDFPEVAQSDAALDHIHDTLHAPIGKLILETWQFPAEIVAVPTEHENLTRDSAALDYSDIVLIANLHSYINTTHRLATVRWADIPVLHNVGLTPEDSVKLLEETKAETNELKNMLH